MQDIVLKESKEHGSVIFPFAYYEVNDKHPRYVMETHWHEECEICRVLSGALEVTIDGINYIGRGDHGVGDVFFFNSGSLHAAKPKACHYECIVFDMHFLLRERSLSNSFIYSLLYNQRKLVPYLPIYSAQHPDSKLHQAPSKREPHFDLNATTDPELVRVIGQMFANLREHNVGFELRTFGILYYLLGICEQLDLYVKPEDTGSNNLSRIMKMRTVLSYIHRNYHQQISLSELSELLELKPPSVVKLFKDIVNKKPMEYINSYRINCAMELLKDANHSVTDVAYETGFNDVSYFTKVFKKYAQVSPREYLKYHSKLV